jgi:nucleoside phosphorylase
MKILVTFALDTEFAPFRKAAEFKRASVDSSDRTYRASIGRADVRVVLTGAGRFATERAIAQTFNEETHVCIAAGLAGALKPEYSPTDVLVGRQVMDAVCSRLIHSDAELVEIALGSGARLAQTLVVTPNVVATADRKRRLGATGDAVDMETIYVMSAAWRHNVRAVAIRAITDPVESDLPLDFDRIFSEKGDVSLVKVLGQLAAHPQQLPALLRLAHQSQRAAGALAEFLLTYIESLEAIPPRESAKADAIAI